MVVASSNDIHIDTRCVSSRVDDRWQSEVIALLKTLDSVVDLFELIKVRELDAGRNVVDVLLNVSWNMVSGPC